MGAKELRQGGVGATELRRCGFSLGDLRLAGFSDAVLSEVNSAMRTSLSTSDLLPPLPVSRGAPLLSPSEASRMMVSTFRIRDKLDATSPKSKGCKSLVAAGAQMLV